MSTKATIKALTKKGADSHASSCSKWQKGTVQEEGAAVKALSKKRRPPYIWLLRAA